MFGNTLHEFLASPVVDIEDKARAFKCFKRIYTASRESKFLRTGDLVTVTGLKKHRSLTGDTRSRRL